MARVSLILPTTTASPAAPDLVASLRAALEGAGHDVEVLLVAGPSDPLPEPGPGWRCVRAEQAGGAAAAIAGLERAGGEVLVVLDPTMGYAAEDLVRVVDPVARGQADLAVASRGISDPDRHRSGRLRAWAGVVAGLLTGTSDPASGLIALTRAQRDEAGRSFNAVGTKFSFELLAKLGGRWVDVPVRTDAPWRPRPPQFDDVRHMKRLADHRFGNLSRLVQFCVVGGSGMVVDLSCYTLLQWIFGRIPFLVEHFVPPTKVTLALALARSTAIAIALCWNFGLNRRLTFSYARDGSIVRQFRAYVLSNLLGILVSLTLSLGLPRKVPFFNRHKLAAAVVGIVAATGISFSMSRWVVFRHRGHHHGPHRRETARAEPEPAPAP